jgi:WhiB family transcriptional regulator, redox-sensing transcriptional regulator
MSRVCRVARIPRVRRVLRVSRVRPTLNLFPPHQALQSYWVSQVLSQATDTIELWQTPSCGVFTAAAGWSAPSGGVPSARPTGLPCANTPIRPTTGQTIPMPVDIRVARSSVAELLDDLAHVPHLPGARCRGRTGLFDRTVPGGAASRGDGARARREARQLCATCPALQACSTWLDSLDPSDRPRGVVAGRFTWRPPKPVDIWDSVRKDPWC